MKYIKQCISQLGLTLAGTLMLVSFANADQVILDDLIVDGSACLGFDCVNGESFGFDTLRVKENNLRIKFQDTSSSASFPTNDWQLTANDSSNGGANKFSIDDIDGGRTPFTVEAGSPSHSLYVESDGDIGIGTNNPVVNLHVIDGNTPTLRLEQDGSSGFTPQTWDVAGNEAGFFIRDATNGSTLPFRIIPGAPSSALHIIADGKVGLGHSSPTAKLHAISTGGQHFVAERTGGAIAELSTNLSSAFIGTRTDHPVAFRVNNAAIMTMNGSGNFLDMVGGGTYAGGTWVDASSRELKENIEELTLDEAADALDQLSPVKYNYKIMKDEPRVGFIAEDVPDLVAMNERKGLSSLDLLGVLTKVVQDQKRLIADQQYAISTLTEKLDVIEQRVNEN